MSETSKARSAIRDADFALDDAIEKMQLAIIRNADLINIFDREDETAKRKEFIARGRFLTFGLELMQSARKVFRDGEVYSV